MQYQIKRGELVVATVTPTGKLSKKVMAEDLVTMNLDIPDNVDFQIRDYCDVFGSRYKLKSLADIKKSSSRQFTHTIYLKGWQYDLQDAAYLFPDANNEYTLSGQPLMGDLNTFIDLLIINANRDQSGWVKGVIDVTDFQLITFNEDDTCLSVLATLATRFKTEWWVDGQTIHMTKKGTVETFALKYGMGNGLYSITRTTSTNRNLVTRLYVYGSERNIPADYKGFSNRLKLPGTIPYLEKNVYINDDPAQGLKYGVIEDTIVFEDIYPKRIGIVTGVTDKFTFTDSAMDFDVNTQLLGVSAKIEFNTGDLAGYTFEIGTYNNATKTFIINLNKDDKDYLLPSDDLKPAVGDQYVILDVKMPQSYIDVGEADLDTEGTKYLNDNCDPIVTYGVDCDPLDFKRKNITLSLGNYVPVSDADFKLNDNLRIIGLTRDLQVTWQYTADLAETVTISAIVKSAVDAENLKKTITRIGKTSNRAYNDALQAKATADGVKLITDYWGVTIDEEHAIVASGTLLVGSGPVGNAGITGVVDNIDETDPAHPIDRSVRFWAGADYEHKDTAPVRITNDGKLIAKAGFIGNWEIDTVGLTNDSMNDVYLKTVKRDVSNNIVASAYVGTDGTIVGDLESAIAVFTSLKVSAATNRALYCKASGSTTPGGNIAAHFVGELLIDGGDIVMKTDEGGGSTIENGQTQEIQYSGPDGDYRLKFRRGIYVGNYKVS